MDQIVAKISYPGTGRIDQEFTGLNISSNMTSLVVDGEYYSIGRDAVINYSIKKES